MSRKLVSSLKKSEILQLPGMAQYRTKTIKELRSIVKNNIINVFGQVNNRGITVDNYNTLYNKYNVNQKETPDKNKYIMNNIRIKLNSLL